MRERITRTRFPDRQDAGKRLAEELREYAHRPDVIVLALPRGGVPVGYEIAHALGAPLDVLIVRKVGVPFQPELAMGAVAAGGVRVLNQDIIAEIDIPAAEIEQAFAEALKEVERRNVAYRDGRPQPDLHGRTVILADDGLATGATMRAAIRAARQVGAATIVVAVPVAAPDLARDMAREVDQFCCILTPDPLCAIGMWYQDFSQLADEDVTRLLTLSAREHGMQHS